MTNNLSNQLYGTLMQADTMRKLLAGFFTDDRQQALMTLQKNGINISATSSAKDIQIAWLKAIKDSPAFRQQAAAVLATYVGRLPGPKAPMSNFVGANQASRQYYNDVADISMIDPSSFSTAALAGASSASSAGANTSSADYWAGLTGASSSSTTATTPSSSSSSSGGFWSSLGSIFTPQVISTGINTGLNALSTSMTSQANQTSEKNALAIEQTKLATAQVQASRSGGLSGGTIAAIAIGGVLVLGIIIVIATRRR